MLLWGVENVEDVTKKAEEAKKVVESLGPIELVWHAVGVALFVGAIYLVYRRLFGGSGGIPDQQKGLRENVAGYPPPPADPGARRLVFLGMPVRLRLVVIAPTGKNQAPITADDAANLLDGICLGLSAILRQDKPRIRIWPPQLSSAGFAPTFHRLIEAPIVEGKDSEWILAAGQAKSGNRPILLGLALLGDEASTLGKQTMQPTTWTDALRVQTL